MADLGFSSTVASSYTIDTKLAAIAASSSSKPIA